MAPLPLHERDVLDVHGEVLAAARGERVLMLSVALEVERPAVDEEPLAVDADDAHVIGKLVDVIAEGDAHLIKIGVPGLP